MSVQTKLRISIFITLASLIVLQDSEAAIDLVSFTATAQDNTALIEWETETEIDNAGFYVTRSTDPASSYDDISGFVPAEGSDVNGAAYQLVDDNVSTNLVYYYILESVDTSQNIVLHGPITFTFDIQVSQTPSATPEPTSTSTETPKPTKTPTTTISPTPTNSRTPTPSRTSTPVTPSFTPTHFTETPTHTLTPSRTPSTTLINAPDIVIKLPSTQTPTSTKQSPTPTSILTATPQSIFAQMIETGSITTIGVICLLILVWGSVAIGIFIVLQNKNDIRE